MRKLRLTLSTSCRESKLKVRMATPQIADQNVKVSAFAKVELDELVEAISTSSPDLKVPDFAVMSALILAARRSPIEGVAAAISTYWGRHIEAAAVESVYAFFAASSRR